jgi:hypothetical protein
MRERNGVLKWNVLTSESPVANPKSGPDYSVFIKKYFLFNLTYPLRCLRVPHAEYHISEQQPHFTTEFQLQVTKGDLMT